jgi:hypothetical protein
MQQVLPPLLLLLLWKLILWNLLRHLTLLSAARPRRTKSQSAGCHCSKTSSARGVPSP